MTTLRDFGGGVDDDVAAAYESDRCIAIVHEQTARRRCRNSPERGTALCFVHHRKEELPHRRLLTINDSPEELIKYLGRRSGRCRALKADGKRCENSTSATTFFCGLHKDQTNPEIVPPEETPQELDQRLIRHTIGGVTNPE